MTINAFHLGQQLSPKGDQEQAIQQLLTSLSSGSKYQTLLGVTGSGKTFTIANVIAQLGRPALVMAHNKTLAAQLFHELREFFPQNAVEFFISYYDYYQPEAYIPSSDTYIAKDASINEDIDKMRHQATRSLFERRDTIIVASVSCIYGLGSPESYAKLIVPIKIGQKIGREDLMRALIDIQYARNDMNLTRGHFRVRGDIIDVLPAHVEDEIIRVSFWGDEIEGISLVDALTGRTQRTLDALTIYPNSHYVTDRKDIKKITREIMIDLGVRLRELQGQSKLVEAQRLEERTLHDVEMLEQLGFCPGVENYSRYLSGAKPGEPPPTLLNYFPKDFITIIDESHITVPQISGMSRGDRARKQNLVEFGFRLPSALDNRPLNFAEFLKMSGQMLFVSATPGPFERENSPVLVEQIIRPTGLLDPKISVIPTQNQIDDLYKQINEEVKAHKRVLVTTLTKKMAEDLSEHYLGLSLKVRYLHSDIDSLQRMEILRDLRKGVFDVLIGINLLREGLDLPEVGLVAVLDADREGFLRSKSSLIQIVGRAARNVEGRVIFYADKITDAMAACIDETERRRTIQAEHNLVHSIEPTTIIKSIPEDLRFIFGLSPKEELPESFANNLHTLGDLNKTIKEKTKEMKKAAGLLEFEKAAQIRDELKELKELMLTVTDASDLS